MKETKEQMRARIFQRVNTLRRTQLKQVAAFIEQLENRKSSQKKSSSAEEDLDAEAFQELAEKVLARRPKDSGRTV